MSNNILEEAFIKSLIALALLFSGVEVLAQETRSEQVFTAYRFFNLDTGQHRTTAIEVTLPVQPRSVNEGAQFGFVQSSSPNFIAIYECGLDENSDHYLSTQWDCENHPDQRTPKLGYLSNIGPIEALGMTTPVVRCFTGSGHMITTVEQECVNNNFVVEGILGYGTAPNNLANPILVWSKADSDAFEVQN